MASDDAQVGAELGALWHRPGEGRRVLALGMTVRDRVVLELRHRILLGELQAGDRVDLDALAAEFGSSRTPIREACLLLANDGLVELSPRSGIKIIGLTNEDLLDNFEVMASLAGMAAGWAAERADDEDRARIVLLRDAVVEASDGRGDVALANYQFHRQINRSCHSRRLMSLIAQTAKLFPDRFSDVRPEQVPCSLREHADIVESIAAHDRPAAQSIMTMHFLAAARRLRDHLAEAGSA